MPAKKVQRKRRVARKGKKGMRRVRRIRNTPEYASLSEQRTMTVSNGFSNNTLYNLMNTSLSQYVRATQVAKAYQHYRIKYIKLSIKPVWDAYVYSGTPGSVGKPNVYYMIDKAGSVPINITLEGLKQMGAKPRALDERPVHIGWRPSVLDVTLTGGGGAPTAQGSKYVISPWLNTTDESVSTPWNPSSVDHLGVYWYVEAPIQGGGNQPYTVDVEVQFEFKKPLIATSVGNFAAVPAQLAQLNASRDGVVDARPGGDDTELVS